MGQAPGHKLRAGGLIFCLAGLWVMPLYKNPPALRMGGWAWGNGRREIRLARPPKALVGIKETP